MENKINIEDLMIGDWVKVKDYPMTPEPRKIIKEHFLRNLCEFEPIPITRNILEKNGFTFFPIELIYGYGVFELKTEHCLLRYSNKHCDIQIFKARRGSIDPESNNCVQRGDRYEIKCGQFLIKYVHELQHILKLCKIEINFEV